MKNIFKIIIAVIAIITVFSSCGPEEADPAVASFEIKTSDTEPVKSGSGKSISVDILEDITVTFDNADNENIVLFTGEPFHVYSTVLSDTANSVRNKGYVVTEDYYTFNYAKKGKYKLVCVARNQWDDGTQYKEAIDSIIVNVIDSRTNMETFGFTAQGVEGEIRDSIILVKLPSTVDLTNLIATFTLTSAEASVSIGTTPQVSGVTANDFSSSLTYTVTANDGTTYDYFTKIDTFSASSEKVLTSFNLSLLETEIVTIGTDTVNISIPWGYGPSSTQLVKWAVSNKARMYLDDILIDAEVTILDVSKSVKVTVEAENGTTKDYYTKNVFRGAISSIKFSDLVPEIVGVIVDTVITFDIFVPASEPDLLTTLTPYFEEEEGKKYANVGVPSYPHPDSIVNYDIKSSNIAVDFTAAADSFQILELKGENNDIQQYTIIINKL